MGLFLSKDINTGLQISLRLIKPLRCCYRCSRTVDYFYRLPMLVMAVIWGLFLNIRCKCIRNASLRFCFITENFRFMKKILWNIRRKLLLLYFGKQSMLERVIFHEDLIVTLSMTCTRRLFSVVIGQKPFLRTCCWLQILNLLDIYWCKI